MIDLLELPDFLDPVTVQTLRATLEHAPGAAATLKSPYPGGLVRDDIRRTTRLDPGPSARDHLLQHLYRVKPQLEAYFGQALGECEAPQFLRYGPGDFFVAHQDGNTPLIHDDSRFRKITAVLFLSTPSEAACPHCYTGGALVFHGPFTGPLLRLPKQPPAGTLVCFRAETTHEVLPVTHGVRYTVACWFRAPGAP